MANCTSKDLESLSKVDIDNHRRFIKEFLSQMFVFQEEEILKKIDPSVLQDRDSLIAYLEKLEPRSYVIQKLIAQAEVWRAMGKNNKLKEFPFTEIWRFVIDGSCEGKGAYYFEDEPGYIVASLKGLLKAFQSSALPSLDHYDNLHNQIIDNVWITADRSCTKVLESFISFERGFAKEDFSYYLTGQDCDKIGLADLMERGKDKDEAPFSYIEDLQKVTGRQIKNEDRRKYVELRFTKMKRSLS